MVSGCTLSLVTAKVGLSSQNMAVQYLWMGKDYEIKKYENNEEIVLDCSNNWHVTGYWIGEFSSRFEFRVYALF